ncbi:predicted protein [Arabidopsis lyrata subsp. lyrata]|uniref:Predicted protein n=1 Tax=Arabidopsis lyrata subsp. lyrata TaxID=81972 RepID=D7L8A3_ARALL|nr:predicted protein [Arabidopsis lyrata subsp. lyrata]
MEETYLRAKAETIYWYAFVEFEEADAAKRAIKASPLYIDGHTTDVGKKRSAGDNLNRSTIFFP